MIFIKTYKPMKHFTQEEFKPSEKTLEFIRQVAYAYRSMKINGKSEGYGLN